MFGIASTGLIVFFGVIIQNLRSGTEKEISSESMRLATAGLITSTYIALVAYCVFLAETFKLAAFSETLVTNFTAVVGTVLAFFFGSSAYIEARTKTEKKAHPRRRLNDLSPEFHTAMSTAPGPKLCLCGSLAL